MPVHVAIMFRPYLRLVLAGRKTVESRLTKRPLPPYRRIAPGERIYFKASAGPYMATAVAGEVEFHEGLTPAGVEALRARHNAEVGGDDAYWAWKRDSRYATFVWLRDVKPITEGPAMAPSRGPAWFVLPEGSAPDDGPTAHVATLTRGGLANGYVIAPATLRDTPLLLELPDGRRVETRTLAGGRVRWRGWRPYFAAHGLAPGDRVHFEMRGKGHYRVVFEGSACPPNAPAHEPTR